MTMKCPYFSTEREQLIWSRQLEEARAKPAKTVIKVDQISDATTFLNMRLSEKRACLRASGIVALPRPREGPKRVDALMIPLLDEEVAYEVLRRYVHYYFASQYLISIIAHSPSGAFKAGRDEG